MDPVARSAAQRAAKEAHDATHFPSPSPSEDGDQLEGENEPAAAFEDEGHAVSASPLLHQLTPTVISRLSLVCFMLF